MKVIGVLVAAVLLLSFAQSEVTRYVFRNNALHVEYGKAYGMLSAQYVSYWPNGSVKAQGAMQGNMRFGEWQLFDSTSKLVMARNYETGYAWTQLFPITFQPVTSKALFAQKYSLFIDIQPDSVIMSARIWRFLPYREQSPVFANNALLDTLIALRDRGTPAGEDDEMMVLSSMAEFHERLDKCNPQHHVIGYRVKEDWYYDAKKQMGVFGIIAICPVLYAKNERDSIDIGWYAYDAKLRSKLSTMFYVPPAATGYPVGVEQTLFLRCFESDVYKTSNVKNYTFAQQFPDPRERALEMQRMEIQPFEWEHDLWLQVFK
jgi:hypothetical protein